MGRIPLEALVIVAALVALSSPAAVAQQVGTTAAVNPAATSARPGSGARQLRLGADVVFRERIATSATGSTQVLFVDTSTLNVGPGSDVVIDEFVYDPRASTGRMTATLARGVLRFVGGAISHGGGVTIRTPAASIGVRGGIVTVRHGGGRTTVVLGFGTATIQTAEGRTTLSRPGGAVTVGRTGRIEGQGLATAEAEVRRTMAETSSRGGQTGGAGRRVATALFARPLRGTASRGIHACTAPVQPRHLGDPAWDACGGPTGANADGLVRSAAQLNPVRATVLRPAISNLAPGPSGLVAVR